MERRDDNFLGLISNHKTWIIIISAILLGIGLVGGNFKIAGLIEIDKEIPDESRLVAIMLGCSFISVIIFDIISEKVSRFPRILWLTPLLLPIMVVVIILILPSKLLTLYFDPYHNYYIIAQHSGKCLDIEHQRIDDGTRIQQWDCNGGISEQWHLIPTDNGYFQIISGSGAKSLSNIPTLEASVPRYVGEPGVSMQ